MVGLTLNDLAAIGTDRSTALRRSWERSFERVFGDKLLGQDFLSFSPASAGGAWRPLLVFNGTSVTTGRRIILSGLNHASIGPVFPDAYDFYSLACADDPNLDKCGDLSLSEAIMVSARFPIVSPAGNLRSAKGSVIDRIVDGGYFENFGAETAVEIARAIRFHGATLGKTLSPFILQISNDPQSFLDRCSLSGNSVATDLEQQPSKPNDVPDHFWLGWLRDPISTVLSTRSARGYHATTFARRELTLMKKGSYSHFVVCPQKIAETTGSDRPVAYKELSMSWWLSMPVQQYLDQQVDAEHNTAARDEVERVLGATH